MADRLVIALPDGRWLVLDREQFEAGLAAGVAFARPSGGAVAATVDELLDAKQIAQRLKLPTNWIAEATRQGRIPCVKFGRYARYSLGEVIEAARRERRGGLDDE